jgi:hypothetical protein
VLSRQEVRALSPLPSPSDGDLAASFATISRSLYVAHSVEQTLHQIADLSVRTIDGCEAAAVSFVQGDAAVTPAWTAQSAFDVDTMQYTTGQGPCLDAIAEETTVYAFDLLTDRRWPIFGPLAARAGMRSVLSFCLFGESTLGALNLYSPLPHAFGATDRATGLIFATHAGVALAGATALEGATTALSTEVARLENLQGALASRQVIGRAEGILMQRELITADQAFDLLRRASQQLNTKLREVAQSVVDTGDLPHASDTRT